jgi:hypothetical protein
VEGKKEKDFIPLFFISLFLRNYSAKIEWLEIFLFITARMLCGVGGRSCHDICFNLAQAKHRQVIHPEMDSNHFLVDPD